MAATPTWAHQAALEAEAMVVSLLMQHLRAE